MSTETRYLIGNWKMNLGPAQAGSFASQLKEACPDPSPTLSGVAAPAISLTSVSEVFSDDNWLVGAQNAYFEENGAFTGEISAKMLSEAGLDFCIVGHSERRHIFGENDALIAARARGVLDSKLRVIYCIGETLEEREGAVTEQVLEKQLAPFFEKINQADYPNIILAYEPVWAIGTGKVASSREILEAHSFITNFCKEHLASTKLPILYGGSVKPENYAEIITLDNVSGALVGGASLKVDSFCKLIAISNESN